MKDDNTTKQVNKVPNPTGKGGFADNPENRSPGGWKKENVPSYQYKRFFNMEEKEFRAWINNNPNRTVVEDITWHAVARARKQLPELKEVTDRVEGRAKQPIEHEGTLIHSVKVEIVENGAEA